MKSVNDVRNGGWPTTLGDIQWAPWNPLWNGKDWEGWEPLVPGDFSGWSIDEGKIIGSGTTALATGQPNWRDYALRARVTAIEGGNIQFLARVQEDGHSFYCVDLMVGWQVVSVNRLLMAPEGRAEFAKISAVYQRLEHGRPYEVEIAVLGQCITIYVDGFLINQVTDDSLTRGRVALSVWESKTAYEDLCIRLY